MRKRISVSHGNFHSGSSHNLLSPLPSDAYVPAFYVERLWSPAALRLGFILESPGGTGGYGTVYGMD